MVKIYANKFLVTLMGSWILKRCAVHLSKYFSNFIHNRRAQAYAQFLL